MAILAKNGKIKVDPITARILSANRAKRQIAGNQAGEIKRKNMQLYEEIKSLRILCRNQEKSLKQFESTQSALPRVLQVNLTLGGSQNGQKSSILLCW